MNNHRVRIRRHTRTAEAATRAEQVAYENGKKNGIAIGEAEVETLQAFLKDRESLIASQGTAYAELTDARSRDKKIWNLRIHELEAELRELLDRRKLGIGREFMAGWDAALELVYQHVIQPYEVEWWENEFKSVLARDALEVLKERFGKT